MNDLLTKKKKVSCETVDNLHHCSVVLSQSLVYKKLDPGNFTIPCIVGTVKFEKALCDHGISINLISLAVYKRLDIGVTTPTNLRLVMEDRSIKRPVGILHDVLVKVADFILPANFVVLDYDADFEVPIILVRPLLATVRVLVYLELNELNFRVGKNEAKFKMRSSTVNQEEISVLAVMDVFYVDDQRYRYNVLVKSE
ncbi:uncharacterized protein LOC107871920 [Capsicum annuum]|uniref:uncharacterized protein LOC107871920 n=1 Tax=Capsicum annuum TaxID=4072 RepID=UPI0007BF7B2B|nr:uncharacterized protein LOC107871920 [Capsicum annuum]